MTLGDDNYMAKLHSKKKGNSGTKRAKAQPSTVTSMTSKADVEEIILKNVKEGVSFPKIGLLLRDSYGVPSITSILGMNLRAFVKKNNVLPEYPNDLLDLIRKAMRVRNHLKMSKKDVHNKVKLMHIESKIQRLVKYYTNKKIMPPQWRYDPEKAALLVK